MIAGLFVVIGHNWPVFFGFQGGKGIACSAAVMTLFPLQGVIAAAACILTLKNEMLYTDLQDYLTLEYELNCDDQCISSGRIAAPQIPSVAPGRTGKVFLTLPAMPA